MLRACGHAAIGRGSHAASAAAAAAAAAVVAASGNEAGPSKKGSKGRGSPRQVMRAKLTLDSLKNDVARPASSSSSSATASPTHAAAAAAAMAATAASAAVVGVGRASPAASAAPAAQAVATSVWQEMIEVGTVMRKGDPALSAFID